MRLNVQITEKRLRSTEEAVAAVSGRGKGPHRGILLNCSALLSDLAIIAPRAKEQKVALQGCSAPHVIDDGALFSYAPYLYQIGRRGACYVDRILKGAKPQDMPVESPRKFDLIVNLRTANAIRLKIPPEVLQLADQVIE